MTEDGGLRTEVRECHGVMSWGQAFLISFFTEGHKGNKVAWGRTSATI